MIKHHEQKAIGEERFDSAYTPISLFIIEPSGQELTQGRKLEAAADAEAMRGASWLFRIDYSAHFLIEPRTAAQGWPYLQWAGPSLPIIRKCPPGLLSAQSLH